MASEQASVQDEPILQETSPSGPQVTVPPEVIEKIGENLELVVGLAKELGYAAKQAGAKQGMFEQSLGATL